MATFVLVHGAWLGGWVWKHVTPHLAHAGHLFYTPTLTGLGERIHLATPAVNLDTHIHDIVQVLEFEDLHEVILVGHSYGGIVITGVADLVRNRLAQLVYLDAFVPTDGQSLHDLVPPEARTYNLALASREGDGWRLPLEPQWRVGPPDLLPWLQPRWTDHPFQCFDQPLRLRQPAGAGLPRTYIRCTANAATGALFRQFADDPTWRVCELAAEHTAMVTAPRALADLLMSLV